MIERAKSLALLFLVLLSLLQTCILAYNISSFDIRNSEEEYIQTDLLGPIAELETLLFPDHVVLHMGFSQSTVLYPQTEAYNKIWESVKLRNFGTFQKTTRSNLDLNWEFIANNHQGVELVFRDGLSLSVLQRILQFKGELPDENHTINRIWIFARDTHSVRTIFFTDTLNVVYEVMNADFTAKDMERYAQNVDQKADVVPYYLDKSGKYYLPSAPLYLNAYSFSYTEYSIDQLTKAFFSDPAVIRHLTERGGTQIYTDAKRGLQIDQTNGWMTYSDPVAASVNQRVHVNENLLSAVQFINQHGGWNSQYALQSVPQRRLLPAEQAFVFRQYYDLLPIMNELSEHKGYIRIVLQNGIVTSYERSTFVLETRNVTSRQVELPGGQVLSQMLRQYPRATSIHDVFPAYRWVVNEDRIELIPEWTIELRDGTYEFIR